MFRELIFVLHDCTIHTEAVGNENIGTPAGHVLAILGFSPTSYDFKYYYDLNRRLAGSGMLNCIL